MLLLDMQQGSPQWAAHRASHFNASDAAAMLGVCPYKTRDQLLIEKKTGIQPEVNQYKKALFERGHQYEEWARPFAESMIGDELFPCVGVLENSRLSASFDGLTMDRSLVWEHKTLSKPLREIMPSGDDLPLPYRVQLEQQLLVSGATKAVFMASMWDENGALTEYYTRDYVSDEELRQRIILGWQQFENDLAEYAVKTLTQTPAQTDTLPALPTLYVESSGDLYFSSNLDQFKQHADIFLDSVNRNLVSEGDFGYAEIIIKRCKTGEEQLSNAQRQLIEAAPELKALFNTITKLQTWLRDLRLDLDKQVKTEKTRIKQALIDAALEQVTGHYETAGVDYLEGDVLSHKLESSIKGLKHRDKLQNAIDRVVLEEKTAFTQRLESGELTRFLSLEDINNAIAPLSLSATGLKQCGFVTPVNRAMDFPKLIRRLINTLSTAKLPLSQTA